MDFIFAGPVFPGTDQTTLTLFFAGYYAVTVAIAVPIVGVLSIASSRIITRFSSKKKLASLSFNSVVAPIAITAGLIMLLGLLCLFGLLLFPSTSSLGPAMQIIGLLIMTTVPGLKHYRMSTVKEVASPTIPKPLQ